MLHFLKLCQKRKCTFLNLLTSKKFRNQKLNYSIAAYLPSSWKDLAKIGSAVFEISRPKKKFKKIILFLLYAVSNT